MSTLQKLKDRARSVDRYWSESRINFVGISRNTTEKKDSPVATRAKELDARPRFEKPNTGRSRPPVSLNRDQSSRAHSSSVNNKIAQNLQGVVEYLFERKSDAKKQELAKKLLWTAVRNNQIEYLRDILGKISEPATDINQCSEFGWNMVDEAVMLGHSQITRELFQHGGKETPRLQESKNQRYDILRKALRRLEADHVKMPTRVAGTAGARQLIADAAAEISVAVLQQMMLNVEKTRPPRSYLDLVFIEACGECASALTFQRRLATNAIVSRYKVEWSTDRSFDGIVDYEIFSNVIDPERLIVEELETGVEYYFRVSVANLADFGSPVTAQPAPFIITSWRDVNHTRRRFDSNTEPNLRRILRNTESVQHYILSNVGSTIVNEKENRSIRSSRTLQRRASLKDTLKSLVKPQSQTLSVGDGGLFITCLYCLGDSILLAGDYSLPSIAITNSFFGTISAKDFLWFEKLCSSWKLAHSLKDLLHSSKDSTTDLRYRILEAVCTLQDNWSVANLGRLYYRPLINKSSNASFLLLVAHVDKAHYCATSPAFRSAHLKEVELLTVGSSDPIFSSLASVGLQEILLWLRTSRTQLPKGLHIGYADLDVSLETVAIVANKNKPNIIPSVHLDSDAHISRNEWEQLTKLKTWDASNNRDMQKLVDEAWGSMRTSVTQDDEQQCNSVYEEVIELGLESSLIILYSENQTLLGKERSHNQRRKGTISMPVQVFESEFYSTYRPLVWSLYCQSSLLLEALAVFLNQASRQGHDIPGLVLQNEVKRIQQLQDELDKRWNDTRWLPNLIRSITSRKVKQSITSPPFNSSVVAINPDQKTLRNENRNDARRTEHTNEQDMSINISFPSRIVNHGPVDKGIPSTNSGILEMEIEEATSAANIVHRILSRHMGNLSTNLSKHYCLYASLERQMIILPDATRIKDFLRENQEAKFFLLQRD